MPQSEFDIIKEFFANQGLHRNDVPLGIGDDCAILHVPENHCLAVSTDTLVSGVHFPADARASDIGYKALAVNLSDLAAMGAEPAWVTLALTLPEINTPWLMDFSQAFFEIANRYSMQLVGGDITRGPLSISVHVSGFLLCGAGLTRHGARAGDRIFVSGNIGDAGLGLLTYEKKIVWPEQQFELKKQALNKFHRPVPRLALGAAICGIASSAIDVSDGLAADLNHILEASDCGAKVDLGRVPVSKGMSILNNQLDIYSLIMSAGDDYELCFTVPENNINALSHLTNQLGVKVSEIGKIQKKKGLQLDAQGQAVALPCFGFDHFKTV
ncbi:MAG: thiamine-phosphate kinase [Gammaproteobacteria bacterium]|nr:thiamine-phosphate kinase [Gammaproteobacteria bacterium]